MAVNRTKLSFLDDRESCEYQFMGSFLVKLEQGFISVSKEAEEDLKTFVEIMCQRSYQVTQDFYELGCALWAQLLKPTSNHHYPAPQSPSKKPQTYPLGKE